MSLIRFSHNRKILKHINEKLRTGDIEVFRIRRGNQPKVCLELAYTAPRERENRDGTCVFWLRVHAL